MIGGFPGDTPYILLSTPEAVAGYAATLKEPIRIVEKQGAATSTLVQSRRFIALDIETWAPGEAKTVRKFLHRGSKKACPALDWQVARIRLISLYEPGAPKPVVIDLGQELSPAMRQALAQLLEILGELTIYGHNLVFDLAFLKHEFGFCPKNVFDTMVAVKLLENDDLAEVYSLAGGHYEPNPEDYHASLVGALGHYLGLELDNELGGGAKSDFGAPSLSGDQYLCSANDARHLPELVGALEKELYAAGLDTISRLEMELISWAARAEVAGVPADADAFDAAIRSLAQAQADFAPGLRRQ